MNTLKRTKARHSHFHGDGDTVRLIASTKSDLSGAAESVVVSVGIKRPIDLSDEQLLCLERAIKEYWTSFDHYSEQKKLDYRFITDIGRRKHRPFIGLLRDGTPDEMLEEVYFEDSASDAIANDWHKVAGELNLALAAHREKLLHD